MVSSSTNICPASTRWDSKISFRSSLPVWVASRDKTVHLCNDKPVMTHDTQSSTIKKLGLDDASTAHDLRNPPAVPCPSVKPWSQVTSKNRSELRKNWYILWHNCHGLTLEPPLWFDTGYYRRSTSIGRRSVHLHWTFAPIAQWHWQRHSRNMPSTMKRSVWPFLRHCRKWSHCLPNDRSKSHWNPQLISADVCCSYLILYTWCHLAIPHHPWSGGNRGKPWKPSGHCMHLPTRPQCCSGAFHLWDMSCCNPYLAKCQAKNTRDTALYANAKKMLKIKMLKIWCFNVKHHALCWDYSRQGKGPAVPCAKFGQMS